MEEELAGGRDRALVIQQENPKVKSSKSYSRYELYKKAKTISQFLDFGGKFADLKNDMSKGFISYGTARTSSSKAASPSSKKSGRSKVTTASRGAKRAVANNSDDEDEEEDEEEEEEEKAREASKEEENGDTFNKRRRKTDEVAWPDSAVDDICDICGCTTLTADGEAMSSVLICESCECEVHLACSGLDSMPDEEESWDCETCERAAAQGTRRRTQLLPLADSEEQRAEQLSSRCVTCAEAGSGSREGGPGELYFCSTRGCYGAYHGGCCCLKKSDDDDEDDGVRCPLCRARKEMASQSSRPHDRQAVAQLAHFRVTFRRGLDKLEQARVTQIILGQAAALTPATQAAYITSCCVAHHTGAPSTRAARTEERPMVVDDDDEGPVAAPPLRRASSNGGGSSDGGGASSSGGEGDEAAAAAAPSQPPMEPEEGAGSSDEQPYQLQQQQQQEWQQQQFMEHHHQQQQQQGHSMQAEVAERQQQIENELHRQQQHRAQQQDQQQSAAPPTSPPPQCYPIARGWWRKFDPSTNRWYFVNEQTGRCQWGWPADAGPQVNLSTAPPMRPY